LTAYCVDGLVFFCIDFLAADHPFAGYREEAADDAWCQMRARFKEYNVLN